MTVDADWRAGNNAPGFIGLDDNAVGPAFTLWFKPRRPPATKDGAVCCTKYQWEQSVNINRGGWEGDGSGGGGLLVNFNKYNAGPAVNQGVDAFLGDYPGPEMPHVNAKPNIDVHFKGKSFLVCVEGPYKGRTLAFADWWFEWKHGEGSVKVDMYAKTLRNVE